MGNAQGAPGPGQFSSDVPEAGQEPVTVHAADRAVEEAERHHEAPDLEPEPFDESDAGDSEPNDQ